MSVPATEKCGWCDQPSVSRVQTRGGKLPAFANVCATHEATFETRYGQISERRAIEIKAEKRKQRAKQARRWGR